MDNKSGQEVCEKALQPKELKQMKPGQRVNLTYYHIVILRVPGGWIYYTYNANVKDITSAVFVPENH